MTCLRLRVGCLALVALLALAFTGCSTVARRGQAVQLFKSQIPSKTPEVNVAGAWYNKDWDAVRLTQKDAEILGNWRDLAVDGVVTGKDVYLLFSQNGYAHYTMKLALTPSGDLEGDCFNYLPSNDDMAPGSTYRRDHILLRKVPPN